ncbi:hypothetical protein SKAU_G00211870 [Synaphobranchus kaupii]|uniref:Uncharacterized protein n=1 Tax=Synaphobranchus kaupii TaxID=118154 RepID=A0A9Q1F961_SYNKA|nr:hypothetical protein SKAU_G00211870 [Synaphobranchus kaupii]
MSVPSQLLQYLRRSGQQLHFPKKVKTSINYSIVTHQPALLPELSCSSSEGLQRARESSSPSDPAPKRPECACPALRCLAHSLTQRPGRSLL